MKAKQIPETIITINTKVTLFGKLYLWLLSLMENKLFIRCMVGSKKLEIEGTKIKDLIKIEQND